MKSGLKILVIRFSSIGDIVLTTPVIRALKVQLDDATIHYCTKESFAQMVENNPYVDKVLKLTDNLNVLLAQIHEEKYDYIIDLHNNLRTMVIRTRTGIKTFAFNKLNMEKWLMVNFKINRLPGKHIVERYMETVAPLGLKCDQLGLDYFIPEKDKMSKDWLPEDFREKYVVYAIGGQHFTKRLSFEKMVELCDRINKPIVLLGGKEDRETGEELKNFFHENIRDIDEDLKKLNKKTLIYNACGEINLNQSASLVKQAEYVFSHDTAIMHIAAAFKKEIFSIWGNTIPEFGMYPYKTKFTVLENKTLSCRPCSKIGYSKCPKGHFKCMKEIKLDFSLE
ncbi:MAG: glycosyltransferase family 9 protein [Cyclobacteriaceae bacterium]|nr:glycosyltransferase family 9 protein [Cyclobacteriaceae bacterium]